MRRFQLPIGAALVLLGVGVVGPALAEDVVERRAVVPTAERPHAEVRIVRRDGATIVQTLVHSRSARRVAGAIAKKEQANWPAGRDGASDAVRFVEALALIAGQVREETAGEDRRRSLCIEFPARGPVTVAGAAVERGPDGLELVEASRSGVALELDDAYVARNRVLIVVDAFEVTEKTAADWLGQIAP